MVAMVAMRATGLVLVLAAAMHCTIATNASDPVVLKGHTTAVTAMAWASDGKTVATASDDRTIRVWELATGQQIAIHQRIARAGYGGPVVAFTSDLLDVAVNYWGEITIRTMADDNVQRTIDPILDRGERAAFRPDVFAMAFSPDGKRLATAGSVAAVGGRHGLPGGIVIIWDVKTGEMVYKSERLSTAASSVAWNADGKRFAAGTHGAGGELPEAGQVLVWNAESGKILHRFDVKQELEQGELASASKVAFSPDFRRFAVPVSTSSRGAPAVLLSKDVWVWDLETGVATQPVRKLKASVGRIAFSPDGKHLATAGVDKILRVWDIQTGLELAAFSNPDRIVVVAFSPDGRSLAIGNADGSVRIWEVSASK